MRVFNITFADVLRQIVAHRDQGIFIANYSPFGELFDDQHVCLILPTSSPFLTRVKAYLEENYHNFSSAENDILVESGQAPVKYTYFLIGVGKEEHDFKNYNNLYDMLLNLS